MKWIEIIKLRSAGKAPEPMKAFLSTNVKNGQPGLTEIRLYRHAAWGTDLALHLYWESETPQKDGSSLGIRLSQTLADFGLVDQSAWIEEV
jgi:hypothetical protein